MGIEEGTQNLGIQQITLSNPETRLLYKKEAPDLDIISPVSPFAHKEEKPKGIILKTEPIEISPWEN